MGKVNKKLTFKIVNIILNIFIEPALVKNVAAIFM